MKLSNNIRKFLRAAGFWLGLPLLALACLLSLLLGQIGVVGVGDRFGISPLFAFNALNILLIGSFTGFLLFVKRLSEATGFINRLRQAFPRFGFPNLNFRSWSFSGFDQTSSTTETAFASRQASEPVCKILFIHYQPAAQSNAAQNIDFDSQNEKKKYAKTNNL